jgi:ubiquinone biosynthesis monooxygenase Coq7
MQTAADEEIDHLSWCEDRCASWTAARACSTRYGTPAFAIGAAAGIAGDDWSLGFVKETENQVEAHLQDHLERLPLATPAARRSSIR